MNRYIQMNRQIYIDQINWYLVHTGCPKKEKIKPIQKDTLKKKKILFEDLGNV